MSLPINLLITTLLIYVVGAFISLAVRRNEQLSINISGMTGVLAGVKKNSSNSSKRSKNKTNQETKRVGSPEFG